MDRFAILVDAGYLLRQAIEIVSQKASVRRNSLDIIDPQGLVDALVGLARQTLQIPDRELLRIYWYDGLLSSGMTTQQKSIAELPDVLFRAGTINSAKQQKGVDSLIVTDLLELASNHAICDAALVTGDSDLAVGIELSQRKGIRVAVIGVEDLSVGVSHHQSFEITSRADRTARMGSAHFGGCFKYIPPAPTAPQPSQAKTPANTAPPPPAPAAVVPQANQPLNAAARANIDGLVTAFISSQASLANAIDPSTKRIEKLVDAALLHQIYVALGTGALTNAERNYARTSFRNQVSPG